MEGLDAAVEHLGEAGEVADVAHGEAGFAQRAGGAAGGDQFDAEAGERLAKSTRPVLSVTLSSARRIFFSVS